MIVLMLPMVMGLVVIMANEIRQHFQVYFVDNVLPRGTVRDKSMSMPGYNL